MKYFFLFSFLINFSVISAVIKHDSIETRLHDYTYTDFCQTMKAKSSTLISELDHNSIECFNEKFKIIDFCLKKLPEKNSFSRGFAVSAEKKVYCEEARAVTISLSCDTSKNLCKNSKTSCEKLKNIYAYQLELAHSSNVDLKLNCYYSKNIDGDLDEI